MIKTIFITALLLAAPAILNAASHVATPPPISGPPPIPPQPGPPPLPQMSVYVVQNGQQTGPFGAQELMQMVASGMLTPNTMVWQDGMGAWANAGSVGPLMALLGQQTGSTEQQGLDAKAYITGTWTSEPTMIPIGNDGTTGLATMSVDYKSDGSLSGNGTIQLNKPEGPQTIFIEMQGTYQAQSSGQNTISMPVNISMTFITNGQTGQEMVNETSIITVIDQTTILDDEGVRWHRQ